VLKILDQRIGLKQGDGLRSTFSEWADALPQLFFAHGIGRVMVGLGEPVLKGRGGRSRKFYTTCGGIVLLQGRTEKDGYGAEENYSPPGGGRGYRRGSSRASLSADGRKKPIIRRDWWSIKKEGPEPT